MNSTEIFIFNGHNGDSFTINRYYFVSIDELKTYCSKQFNIPINQLFMISPLGIKLRSSSIEQVDEIYVFNRDLFTSFNLDDAYLARILKKDDSAESLIRPINSPLLDLNLDDVSKSRNSRQLTSLLTTNLGWVSAIESDSKLFAKKVEELKGKIKVLFKSLKIANQYIDSYCADVKKTFDSSVDFVIDLQKHSLNLIWKDHFEKLEKLQMADGSPLSSLLNKDELTELSHQSIKINEKVSKQFSTLKPKVENSKKGRQSVENDLEFLQSETNKVLDDIQAAELIRELQLLSNKVRKDTTHLLNENSPGDDLGLDLILEIFQNHKDEYVNSIYQISTQLYQGLITTRDIFTRLQLKFTKFLQRLAIAQSEMLVLKEPLKSITPQVEEIQNFESTLAHTVDLPLLYGFYLIEVLRREEWLTAVKQITKRTNEKFAGLREKEIKLRNQWIKNYGIILRLLNHEASFFDNNNIINFEIVINEDKTLKQTESLTFQDCNNYIQQLNHSDISQEVVEVLIKAFEEMSSRKVSLSIDSKTNESESIKGYKQRIKKLENLLHQEQFKNFSQWPTQVSNPRLSAISRYSTVFDNSVTKSQTPENGELFSPPRSLSPQNNSEDLSKLTLENKDLANSLKRNRDVIESLKDEVRSLKQILSAKEFENKEYIRQIEITREQKQSEASRLQIQITEEQMSNVQLHVDLESKQAIIKEFELKLKEREQLVEELKFEHSKTVKEFKEKELQNVPREKLVQLESMIESLRKENDDVKNIIIDKESKLQENIELIKAKESTIEEHMNAIDAKNQTIDKLQSTITSKDQIIKDNVESIDVKTQILRDHLQSIKVKDETIEEITKANRESVRFLELKIDELTKQNTKYESQIDTWQEDFERLKSMKNDLLENMSNRENEFAKEKDSQQQEIEELREKVEDLESGQQEAEKAISEKDEVITKQSRTVFKLIIIINSLIIKSKDLCDILFTFYRIFITSLKSIGLLAVRTESKVDIIRVKGLRKNSAENLMATVDLTNGFKPIVDEDILSKSIWTTVPDESLLTELNASEGGLNLGMLDDVSSKIIDNYNLTTYEDKFLKFVDQITNLNAVYVNSVAKRFKEVESLAKKELKENKKLKEDDQYKITIKNFKVGDSVLFLPTSKQEGKKENQWAAFNDQGDAKYLMKNTGLRIPPQKQWFIGKVLELENVDNNEYLITTEVNDVGL